VSSDVVRGDFRSSDTGVSPLQPIPLWDSGLTKTHWGSFLSQNFSFPLSNVIPTLPYSYLSNSVPHWAPFEAAAQWGSISAHSSNENKHFD
jgi:hypothetical protein